jgi:hypothetical protein
VSVPGVVVAHLVARRFRLGRMGGLLDRVVMMAASMQTWSQSLESIDS